MSTGNHQFQAEIQQVLDILIHSLYSEPEIFLRELVSNASDALSRFKYEQASAKQVVDPSRELAIWLEGKPDEQMLILEDAGIGMSAEEMVNSLGTIARSGAKAFIQALKESNNSSAAEVIGQFGVGFYSVFMVAEEVTVDSRSYKPEEAAARWISDGKGGYRIEASDKESRGTRISIKLKDEHKDFADAFRLGRIIKQHSDYVQFPIYVLEDVTVPSEDEDAEPQTEKKFQQKNSQEALWRKTTREVEEDAYKEFYQSLTYDFSEPLATIHTNTDVPIQLFSLLFVPSKRNWRVFQTAEDEGLKLYVRKVLIDPHHKLLPPYLRFIQGVVDTEDLPLNVSRQMVQSSPLLAKIADILIGKIASELKKLAKDKEKYTTFWLEFGQYLKEGVGSDHKHREKWLELLRFPSTQSTNAEDVIALKDYVERMKPEQEVIYYLSAESYSSASRSAHLEYFRQNELEVLLFADPIDAYMLMGLQEYDGKKLQNIDDAELDLPESTQENDDSAEALPEDSFKVLKEKLEGILGERITEVRESKILTDAPVRLVNPSGSMDAGTQRLQMLMGQEVSVPAKIMEVNRKSSLIQNISQRLQADADDPLISALTEQLYESALVAEGIHPNPAEMLPRIQQLMEAAAKS